MCDEVNSVHFAFSDVENGDFRALRARKHISSARSARENTFSARSARGMYLHMKSAGGGGRSAGRRPWKEKGFVYLPFIGVLKYFGAL